MRNCFSFLALLTTLTLLTGCANTERKFGRGVLNATEFARMGELRRAMEQTALWENTEATYTTGFVRGFNRSVARTGVGLYEIVTAPFPPYDPIFLPVYPVYPDSYKPKLLADPTFAPDSALGFSGGDVAPMIPGSRFRIFDY